jgi:hypothetical protein
MLELGSLGLLVIENLGKRQPGRDLARRLYISLTAEAVPPWERNGAFDRATYDMFILGIAHKCLRKAAASEFAKGRGIVFEDVVYQNPDGTPQYAAIKEPLGQTSKRTYKLTMAPIPEQFIAKVGRIADGYLRHARGRRYANAPSIILGDNKPFDNMVNDLVCDLHMVGEGEPMEDIMHALVEPRLGIPLTARKRYMNEYVRMRCLHDEEFRTEVMHGKEQEMFAFMDAATVVALSVYAGCTRKRVKQMEDGSIWPRRQYFINALQWMLDHGDFTAVGA